MSARSAVRALQRYVAKRRPPLRTGQTCFGRRMSRERQSNRWYAKSPLDDARRASRDEHLDCRFKGRHGRAPGEWDPDSRRRSDRGAHRVAQAFEGESLVPSSSRAAVVKTALAFVSNLVSGAPGFARLGDPRTAGLYVPRLLSVYQKLPARATRAGGRRGVLSSD